MKSLKLNTEWDIELDTIGILAFVEEKEDVAQTVANATRVFQGNYIFDTGKGIPYIPDILGQLPRNIDVPSYMRNEAEKVSGVKYAEITDIIFEDRVYKADIQITTDL